MENRFLLMSRCYLSVTSLTPLNFFPLTSCFCHVSDKGDILTYFLFILFYQISSSFILFYQISSSRTLVFVCFSFLKVFLGTVT